MTYGDYLEIEMREEACAPMMIAMAYLAGAIVFLYSFIFVLSKFWPWVVFEAVGVAIMTIAVVRTVYFVDPAAVELQRKTEVQVEDMERLSEAIERLVEEIRTSL